MNKHTDFEELATFAAKDGFHWRAPAEGSDLGLPWESVFALTSGDPDFYCFREDGFYVVRKRERGEYSGRLISSDELSDIEKFLSFILGNGVRAKMGLSRIWLDPLSLAPGDEVNGVRVSGSASNITLMWRDGDSPRVVSELGRLDASRFVRYAKCSAAEIRASFLEADGHPLFTSAP